MPTKTESRHDSSAAIIRRQIRNAIIAATITVTACSSTVAPVEDAAPITATPTTTATDSSPGTTGPTTTSATPASASPTTAQNSASTTVLERALPQRAGPREETSGSVPHVQLNAEPIAAIDAELHERAFSIPGVENMPSQISGAGTVALWFRDDITLERPEILLAGREFAHIHPDGSLHVWLPVELAQEVDATGWGELHPWVDREGFWDGVTMVFTPRSVEEVDLTISLLVEAYNFVAGQSLDPNAY